MRIIMGQSFSIFNIYFITLNRDNDVTTAKDDSSSEYYHKLKHTTNVLTIME